MNKWFKTFLLQNTLFVYNHDKLEFERITLSKLLFSMLLIGLVFSSLGFSSGVKFNMIIEKIPIIIKLDEEKFTPELLKTEIKRLNIQHPDIVYNQCVLESNNFKSNIWKNNNNFLGMTMAKLRPTTAIGIEFNHAVYKSWRDCLIDYALWQASYGRGLTQSQYLELLGEIYAEDPEYIKKLKLKLKSNDGK